MAKTKNKKEKMFVIQKTVMASSLLEAYKKEKTVPPEGIWINDDWKKNNL